MNLELTKPLGNDNSARQLRDTSKSRVLGRLVSISGVHALIATDITVECNADQWSVGHLISIQHDESRIVGVVCEMTSPTNAWASVESNCVLIKVELSGAVVDDDNGQPRFFRGIQAYPRLGSVAHRIRASDLAAIYAFNGQGGTEIGRLSQDSRIPAKISFQELIARHFAVIGSTGVGKTTAVCSLIKQSLVERPNLRFLIVDPHNEFASHFPANGMRLDADNLELPFWMFKFDEMVDIIFAGRAASSDEADALYDLIKMARIRFTSAQSALPISVATARRAVATETGNISADTPVPYRITDAIQVLDGWMGKLDQSFSLPVLRALKNRIESLARDPRYRFMFGKAMVEDNMARVISRIFRIPAEGKPVTILQLAGLPNEVVNSVVSVLARLSFDLALNSNGGYEIMVVCEEAHRYIPNDKALGFAPTRQAIGRIAKEGRKYGVSLGVVTQRPSELDSTVLSQCSTMFVMRLPNESDKAIVRSALSDSSASILSFLSSLADREVIAFGEAVPTPMRMRMATVESPVAIQGANERPSEGAAPMTAHDVNRVIRRLRGEVSD